MHIYEDYDELPERFRNSSIAIGNFDGVHQGHAKVISRAGIFAHERGVPWGVLTFEPHPRELFDKRNAPLFRLTPFEMKSRQIKSMGVDFLVVIHFDLEFSNITADEFVDQILVHGFEASYVVSGFNFAFGHKRAGDTRFLKMKGEQFGFGTSGIKQVLDDHGEIISSTRIRKFLSDGNPRAANKLLGRNYEIEGKVSQGDQRGRKIGFPTANIELNDSVKTATGVYAIKASVNGSTGTVWHDGVANLGYRPTFNGDKCVLETHLFNFNENIYDANLRVALIDFIRKEQNFNGVESLKTQIKKDISQSKFILANKIKENI
jgi:riboflavin kinase / FMN adenylyltransferase